MSKNTTIRTGAIVKVPTQSGDRVVVGDDSVSTSKLQDLAVTKAKLAVTALHDDLLAINMADYTILDNDGYDVFLVTTGASDRTVTLPTAADNAGRRVTMKKVDSGAGFAILDGEGAETIDAAADFSLYSQNDWVTVESDGSNWIIIGHGVKNRIQTNLLSANVTSDGVMTDLTFSNLIVGKWYEVTLEVRSDVTASESNVFVLILNGATTVGSTQQNINQNGGTLDQALLKQTSVTKFQATDTTVTFSANNVSSDEISGDGTRAQTWTQLEERNDLVASTAF